MKHIISTTTLGSPGFIEIDEVEYNSIKDARQNLFEALYLEEKLDLVTENYYEYETELLSIASRMMVFADSDYFSMSRERNLISRRIVNLLSAGKMYLDQSVQHLETMYGKDSDILSSVKKEKEFQYDQKLGYRVMQAMRNYAQHRGFPIQSIKFSHQRVDSDGNFQLLHRAIPLINISTLEDDGNFKKAILKELKDNNNEDTIDIRRLIREYVEGIGNIQVKTRELVQPDLIKWEQIFDNTIDKYKKEFGEDASLAGLAIIKENENLKWEETKTLFKDFMKKRVSLENKNKTYVNLHKSYASNEIRKND